MKESWGGGREQEFIERLNEDDVSRVSWRIELDGEIRSRVDLTRQGRGGGGGVSLGITFLWEEKEEVGAAWGFLSLCRLPALDVQEESAWHPSLSAAVAGLSTSMENERSASGSQAIPIAVGGKEASRADGEGTTPGAYGAAEDFWEGWGNDDEATTTTTDNNSGYDRYGGGENRDYRDRYKEEVKEAEVGGYWDRYGSVESGVGEGNILNENVKVVPIANGVKEQAQAEKGVTNGLSRSITRSRRSSTIKAPTTGSFTDTPSLSKDTPALISSRLVAPNSGLEPSSPQTLISTPMYSDPTITSATSPQNTTNPNLLIASTSSTSSTSPVSSKSFPSPCSSYSNSSTKRPSKPHPPTSLPSSHHYSAFDAAELQAEKLADQAREMEEAVLMSMKGLFKVWCGADAGISNVGIGGKGKEGAERERKERERKWLELASRASEK